MPQFIDQFPQVDSNAPRYGFHTGFLTGMLELGAFVGCLFFPYVADRISRKWGISIATGFFCVGAIIQTAANEYDTLVAGRFIGGIGVGTLAMGAPLYISEIAPPNLRGSLMVLEAISIVIGAVVAYWITYGTRYVLALACLPNTLLHNTHIEFIEQGGQRRLGIPITISSPNDPSPSRWFGDSPVSFLTQVARLT